MTKSARPESESINSMSDRTDHNSQVATLVRHKVTDLILKTQDKRLTGNYSDLKTTDSSIIPNTSQLFDFKNTLKK